MSHKPSVAQQAYYDKLDTTTSSIVLIAVAGAGKTTTAIKGLDHMTGTVCMLAYNSKIAKELKERIGGREGVEAKTFHGAGFSALRRAFRNAPWAQQGGKPNDKKVREIVDEIIAARARPDLVGIEDVVCAVVSMAKQRGFGVPGLTPADVTSHWEEMIEHFALDDGLPEGQEEMIPHVIALAKIALRVSTQRLSETIDFDDMVYGPLVLNLRMWQYDNLIVDEAQDTNPTRRALARKMLKPGGRMVAIGDPHQAIYGFTGTDNDSLQQIARQFGCVEMPLTVTYRCPKAVVAVARQWVSHIEAHESAPEGEVVRYSYDEVLSRVQVGDAVLCRFNKYLVSLVFKLIKSGVPAKIEGRAIGQGLAKLAGKWKVKTLDALVGRLKKYEEREVEKAKAKDDERKIEEIIDRVDTMFVLIERAREQKIEDVRGLQDMILGLFDDNVEGKRDMVVLCSEHRSKGLEWDRVHILGLDELQPGRARHDWQLEQEYNLMYVAVTRAKKVLHLVHGVREERVKRPED